MLCINIVRWKPLHPFVFKHWICSMQLSIHAQFSDESQHESLQLDKREIECFIIIAFYNIAYLLDLDIRCAIVHWPHRIYNHFIQFYHQLSTIWKFQRQCIMHNGYVSCIFFGSKTHILVVSFEIRNRGATMDLMKCWTFELLRSE